MSDEQRQFDRLEAITQRANLAKLDQLIADANKKVDEYFGYTSLTNAEEANLRHWRGVRDGLRRARRVVDGQG